MSNKVYANGNAIACKSGDGKVIASFPDVCLSPPSPPAGPIPVPYPNTSFSKDMQNGSRTIKIDGKEIMLKDKSYYKTAPLGDEAATNGLGAGVISHVITGKTYFVAWSMDVKFEGDNVDRHLDITTSNHACPMANDNVPNPGQEEGAQEEKCPPHAWSITSEKTAEQAKADNEDRAKYLRGRGGKQQVRQAETLEFANKAIDANMDVMHIRAVEVNIKCDDCGEEGEIDILGDEQVAESQSVSAENYRKDGKKRAQADRLNDYQSQMNKRCGTKHKPRAKFDDARVGEEQKVRDVCAKRQMAPEFI